MDRRCRRSPFLPCLRHHSSTPVLTISQGNLLPWRCGPPYSFQLGDRSLMWVCHITGTPGCSTALCSTALCSAPLHCTQARYFTRTAEDTICIISERLLDRPRHLPLHSLTAEAEGGYLYCSRTSAMSSSPLRTGNHTFGTLPAPDKMGTQLLRTPFLMRWCGIQRAQTGVQHVNK